MKYDYRLLLCRRKGFDVKGANAEWAGGRALRDFEFVGAAFFGVGRAGLLSGITRSFTRALRDS
jgi:hypothetical protein